MVPGDLEDGPSEVDDNTEPGGAEEGHTARMRRVREADRSKKKYWMEEGSRCTFHLQATSASQRNRNHHPRTTTHDHHHQSYLS